MKEIITNRRTVRNFDPNYQLTDEQVLNLINDAQRAPSSMNLQPWRFVVANNQKAKQTLKTAMKGNFLQFDTASTIFVVLNDKLAYNKGAHIFGTSNKLGLMPSDVMERQIEFANSFENVDSNYYKSANYYDIGLVSMNLVSLARLEGLETSIMRGYDQEAMLKLIGMDSNQFDIVAIIAIGKSVKEGFPSYRMPAEETSKFL